MPLFVLQGKGELEGVEWMRPKAAVTWTFDIENDANERREGITVCSVDELELEGSRGTANFVMKFNKGDHSSYIKFEKLTMKKHGTGVITEAQSGLWVTLAVMECRGLTPLVCQPGNYFDIKSKGEKEKIFEDADFGAEPDWADYDEENDLSVQVSNFALRVIKE